MRSPGRHSASYDQSVFINCPFDEDYDRLLRPLLFTILRLGFSPRIATERSDSGENRVDKIVGLIRDSRFSIHDISRLRSADEGEYARFNLPFELGVDRGAQLFGSVRMRRKCCLILESQPYDFKRALSDLSGVDIKHHRDDPAEIVRAFRNWFVETVGLKQVAGATAIWYGFTDFNYAFHNEPEAKGFSADDLNLMPVPEYIDSIRDWLAATIPLE